MHAELLLCLNKRLPWIVHVKKICFSILPFILCVMLLLTSSCFWRFDRDGPHDGHDQDKHHDHERYDRQKERDGHSMNIKHQEYKPDEISRQSKENTKYSPAESLDHNKIAVTTEILNQKSGHFKGVTE